MFCWSHRTLSTLGVVPSNIVVHIHATNWNLQDILCNIRGEHVLHFPPVSSCPMNIQEIIYARLMPDTRSSHSGLRLPLCGIQLSWWTLMLLPSPILHIASSRNRSCLRMMLLKVNEPLLGDLAFIMFPSRKHPTFNTWAHREAGNCRIPHACFAGRAWLKASNSQKPIPPSRFLVHIFSHAIQCTFFHHLLHPTRILMRSYIGSDTFSLGVENISCGMLG